MIDLEKEVNLGERVERENMKQFAWLLLAVSVLGFGTLGLYKPVLAPYLKSLGFSAGAIGFTVGLMGLSKSLTNIPAGILSDKYGRKPVALVGLMILGICYPFYLISKSIILLGIARILNGIGNSAAAQPAMTAIADLLGKRRAFGMGVFEAVNYIAVSGGTLLAGYMAARYGMLSAFYVGLPICLLGALVLYKFFRESKPVTVLPGSAAGQAGIETSQAGERLQSSSDVWKKLLANPGYATMCYLGFMTKMTDEGILVTLIPLVAATFGLKPAEIAGIMATGYLTFALIQPVTGIISDRIGRKPMFVLGLSLLLIAALLLPYAKNYLLFSIFVIVLKVGNALLYPSLPAAAVDVSPKHFRGTGLSVYRFFRDAGVFGGPLIAGIALDIFGRVNSFYFIAAMFAVGLVLTMLLFRETIDKQNVH